MEILAELMNLPEIENKKKLPYDFYTAGSLAYEKKLLLNNYFLSLNFAVSRYFNKVNA